MRLILAITILSDCHSQCLSEGDLASIYGLDLSSGVTKEQFIALCPALIQQQIGNHCASAAEVEDTTEDDSGDKSEGKYSTPLCHDRCVSEEGITAVGLDTSAVQYNFALEKE